MDRNVTKKEVKAVAGLYEVEMKDISKENRTVQYRQEKGPESVTQATSGSMRGDKPATVCNGTKPILPPLRMDIETMKKNFSQCYMLIAVSDTVKPLECCCSLHLKMRLAPKEKC